MRHTNSHQQWTALYRHELPELVEGTDPDTAVGVEGGEDTKGLPESENAQGS